MPKSDWCQGADGKNHQTWLNMREISELTRFVRLDTRGTRGGDATGVGCTCPEACLVDKVTVPLEVGHNMTSGVLLICPPKPLPYGAF